MRKSAVAALILLTGCGTLDKKTIQINAGDDKEKVLKIMGAPGDRQFKDGKEAWQYCRTGAGFGYHDYKIVWMQQGMVRGITSFKGGAPGSCKSGFTPIRWEDAPDSTIEIRNR